MVPTIPQMMPMRVPPRTWPRVCWRNTIRLVMTQPETRIARESHQMGLKPKMAAYATKAPMTPPEPAECMLTFHHKLTTTQTHWMSSEMPTIAMRKRGMCVT